MTERQADQLLCLAEMHNKKIVVRIITFRVDKFSESDIIKTVPAR